MMGVSSKMPCFEGRDAKVLEELKQRFWLEKSEEDVIAGAIELIKEAHRSKKTAMYDNYQYYTRGIL